MNHDWVFFHIDDAYRSHLIARHNFYVEQAKQRLLSQFGDLDVEAHAFADRRAEELSRHFDPERHDPSDIDETAYEDSIEYYNLLDDMKRTTLLSLIAGMFHEWDKKLRDWLVVELSKAGFGKIVKRAIWKATFAQIVQLLESLGMHPNGRSYLNDLEACCLVVNVYKHGPGTSLNRLKACHRHLLDTSFSDSFENRGWGDAVMDDRSLKVEEANFDLFSKAIVSFWTELPKAVLNSEIKSFPQWLSKAIDDDQKHERKQDNCTSHA